MNPSKLISNNVRNLHGHFELFTLNKKIQYLYKKDVFVLKRITFFSFNI